MGSKPLAVTAFTLPLDKEQFMCALQRGQGRVLVHAANQGVAGFETAILDACIHNLSFDPQCEVSRAAWLVEILEAGDLIDTASSTLIASFERDLQEKTFWDRDQLCQIACLFACKGHAHYRELLYSIFSKREDSADLIAGEEIVVLDGTDGLLFVANRIGEWLLEEPDLEVSDLPLNWYDEQHAPGDAARLLEAAAANNTSIARYVAFLESGQGEERRLYVKPDHLRFGTRSRPSRMDAVRKMSGEQVIEEIGTTHPLKDKHWYRSWGRSASLSDLALVQDQILSETDPGRLFKYLKVFQAVPFPAFNPDFVELVDHEDPDVRWIALRSIANNEHPAIRARALQLVEQGLVGAGELQLFTHNYKNGDWELIKPKLQLPQDSTELHWTLMAFLDIYQENTEPEALEPMLLIYEHTPCCNCRHDAVKLLKELESVPEWIIRECRYDADPQTRKLIAG